MADVNELLSVLKIDGTVYEIHDAKARTDIENLNTNVSSTYATKDELQAETQARTTAVNNAKTELMGTSEDTTKTDTIKGLRKALDELSSTDTETLATINKIKAELENPDNTDLATFLDKITSLISGFNTDTTAEGYKTIKKYIDDINAALTATIVDNEHVTSAALNDLKSDKAEKTEVNTAIETVQGSITAETQARAEADTTLDGKITTEETAREAADNTLDGKIDQEISDRGTAITGLTTRIDGIDQTIEDNEEVTAAALNDLEDRKANKTDVQGQISDITGTDADTVNDLTLHGLKKSYETLSTTITGADEGVLAVLNKIKKEITDPTSGEGLNSFLDTLNTLISGFDNNSGSETYTGTIKQYIDGIKTTLQNNIDSKATTTALQSEASTRADADTALDTRITTEETARTNKDTELENSISSEVTAREQGDATVKSDLIGTATDDANADTIKGLRNGMIANEKVTAAALVDLETRKINKTNIKEIEVITNAVYNEGTLELTKATVKVIDFEADQNQSQS